MRRDWLYRYDDTLGCFGEIDWRKKTIRINRARHKRHHEPIIDTIVHELMHKRFPRLCEETIRRKTARALPRLTPATKRRMYRLFS